MSEIALTVYESKLSKENFVYNSKRRLNLT